MDLVPKLQAILGSQIMNILELQGTLEDKDVIIKELSDKLAALEMSTAAQAEINKQPVPGEMTYIDPPHDH